MLQCVLFVADAALFHSYLWNFMIEFVRKNINFLSFKGRLILFFESTTKNRINVRTFCDLLIQFRSRYALLTQRNLQLIINKCLFIEHICSKLSIEQKKRIWNASLNHDLARFDLTLLGMNFSNKAMAMELRSEIFVKSFHLKLRQQFKISGENFDAFFSHRRNFKANERFQQNETFEMKYVQNTALSRAASMCLRCA